MTTALIITTFNRPHELRQCLESVSRASKPDVLIIVDDASTDKETITLVRTFYIETPTYIVLKTKNGGIKESLKTGFDIAFNHYRCDLAINLDADAIVKRDFIPKLKALYDGKHIVSGFNCNHPKNPILNEQPGYVVRKHANGINMLVDRKQYETVILPALNSKDNWDFNSTNQYPFRITKPSVVQHIGAHSSTMGHVGGDVACDFKKLHLPTVTLFGIDSHDKQGILKAAQICQQDIDFGKVTIITEDLFTKDASRETRRMDYSRFMVKDLAKYVETTHVLTIHADGYVLNSGAWDESWLRYDYIGALWHWKKTHRNGNGGFSLRSQKFARATAELSKRITDFHPEDEKVADKYRPVLEKEFGIKYAPDDVCLKFSIEAFGAPTNKYSGQFGFHGGQLDFSQLPKGQRPYDAAPVGRKRAYPALEAYKNRAIGRYRR